MGRGRLRCLVSSADWNFRRSCISDSADGEKSNQLSSPGMTQTGKRSEHTG